MPKKKQAKKRAAGPPGKRKGHRPQKGGAPAGHGVERRTICANAECKLRRAGCLGYEACPGFKGRSG
ncbi:MAG: hypothetical protein P8Y85_00240 [Nitrospirota bacterium]|jgi:hypothetical protein